MTKEEALKRFKWKYNLTKDYNDPHWEGGERREHSEWVEQLEIAVNALEKQIPKKPYKVKEHKQNDYYCVVCKRYLGDEMELKYACLQPKYCENCGQALNWSDTE